MKAEIAIAQLSIVDGAWQESPDTVAQFESSALFGGAPGRGNLYLVVEVMGDVDGRDALARGLIETARREYAASRGSIMRGLAQALRAANDSLYTTNATSPAEARRIAGMTAAILREDELFIAQAGPGLACLARGATIQRYPAQSPWFDPDEEAIGALMAARNFPSDGTVPVGMRRNYNPDQFHVTLQPGDVVLLSSRSLVHLLSNEELLDTLSHRHPDEIIANLEDLAGAADLSVIAIQVAENAALARTAAPAAPIVPAPPVSTPPLPAPPRPGVPDLPSASFYEDLSVPEDELEMPASGSPATEQPAAESKPARPRVRIDWARVRAAILRVTAGTMAALAAMFSRVDWKNLSAAADHAISRASRSLARALLFLLRNFLPGEPPEEQPARATAPALEGGWRLLAFVFPLVLIAAGGWMWGSARVEQQRAQAAQVTQFITQAKAALESGRGLVPADRNAARDAFQKAIGLTDQAKAISPADATARTVAYQAQDELDKLNGISVMLYLPSFATYADTKANPARIVARYPDVYVLDRGLSRVFHYLVNEAGPGATPTPGDGIILRAGDKAADRTGDRTVGELIDLTWVEQGNRLIAIDKTGAFLEYDPAKSTWSARAARDGDKWSRVNLASNYAGNLYLIDPGRSQILKYVAAEGAWTSSVTYFAPGVNVDLSSVTDIAIDGDVWLARADGSIARFNQGKPNDLTIRDLDPPLSKSMAVFTTEKSNNVYVADAGNQRIVQIDKTTGRFARQFKPTSQLRGAFSSLKALAVDESKRFFYFINGNQAYLATIPQ